MVSLIGPSVLGADGWKFAEGYVDHLRNRGIHIPQVYRENSRRYWTLGSVYHAIRPEVAWCQHAKETNYCRFGGVLDESFHNPAGIKTRQGGGDYDKDAHERFVDWDEGIRAHINHLTAYAYDTEISPIGIPHGRYYSVQSTAWAGTIKEVEQLNGKWAPSPTYGNDLIKYQINPFLEWSRGVIRFFGGTPNF